MHTHTHPHTPTHTRHALRSNGHLNFDAGLNVDDDLLDDLGRGVEVNEALVDAHLVRVPGLGTLAVGRLARRDLQVLGGQAHGALDAQLLVLGAVNELLAHLLERLDVARREGDADLVDLGALAEVLFGLVWWVGLDGWWGGERERESEGLGTYCTTWCGEGGFWLFLMLLVCGVRAVTTWILDHGNVMTGVGRFGGGGGWKFDMEMFRCARQDYAR